MQFRLQKLCIFDKMDKTYNLSYAMFNEINRTHETFRRISISELRAGLAKLKRKVQLGQMRLVITCYGEIVGYLVPMVDVDSENGFPSVHVEEMPLTKFRDQVHESWERLQAGVDCIYLTFHTRPVVAFVSDRLAVHLPIPLARDADKISSLINNSTAHTLEGNSANV